MISARLVPADRADGETLFRSYIAFYEPERHQLLVLSMRQDIRTLEELPWIRRG